MGVFGLMLWGCSVVVLMMVEIVVILMFLVLVSFCMVVSRVVW